MEQNPKQINISEEAIEEVVETVVKDVEEAGLMDSGSGCVNGSCPSSL